jgi:hypothetical protein
VATLTDDSLEDFEAQEVTLEGITKRVGLIRLGAINA